jgi:PAS domain S-box-containing protein
MAHSGESSDDAQPITEMARANSLGASRSEERIGFFEDALRWAPDIPTHASRFVDGERAVLYPADANDAIEGPLRLRVLLADGDDNARDDLARVLGERYEVIAVADTHEALRVIQKTTPDFVLADVGMLPGNGLNLIRELRASNATRAIPVMLLSEDASDAARIEGFEAGAVDFLARPFNTRELTARMAAHMALDQLRREVAGRQAQLQRLAEIERANDALRSEIAVRKHIEAALELQIQVLNNIPAVAWTVTPDGQLDFINQFYLNATGLTADECLAPAEAWKTHREALPPFLSRLHPDHVGRVQKIFWGGIRSGQGWAFEAQFLHADGQYHWHFDRAVPLRNAQGKIVRFVGTTADIDELRLAQEALQLSEQRARLIVDMALDAVITIDASGCITSWNRQAEQVFGWPAAETIGRPIAEIVIPADRRPAHASGMHRFIATGEGPILNRRIEIMALHRRGHIFPVELTVAPIKLQQGWTFSAFVRDLTEQKAKDAALRETQAELARVSRITTTTQFAAWISHEVNQPLSAVVSNGQTCLHWLADRTFDLAKARAAAEHVVRDARRTADVVRHIRAIATKSEPEQIEVDVNGVISEVLDLLDDLLRAHAIIVASALAADIPPVLGDRVQLQQVLLNLLVNAIEAMSAVADRQRTLRVQSRRDGTEDILVTIQDSGMGVEAQEQEQIFEPFFTTKQRGMGMGLAICRSIIEAHGGRLWATPGQPTGAVFQFVLPTEADRG